MLRVGHVFAVLVIALAAGGGYAFHVFKNQPRNIPFIKAPTEPYKRLVETDPIKTDATTHSTVHAVIGGNAQEDPSLKNLPPLPAEMDEAIPTDVPTGFSVPKEPE